MWRVKILSMMLVLAQIQLASASEYEPCRIFVSDHGKTFRLGDAYRASDLVAIGQIVRGNTLVLQIKNKIKGNEVRKEVTLTSPTCMGTSCSGGFSVAQGIDLLFLLQKLPSDKYDSVTGNGNFSCPVVYEVKNDLVEFGNKKVPMKSLKRYLEVKPDSVSL